MGERGRRRRRPRTETGEGKQGETRGRGETGKVGGTARGVGHAGAGAVPGSCRRVVKVGCVGDGDGDRVSPAWLRVVLWMFRLNETTHKPFTQYSSGESKRQMMIHESRKNRFQKTASNFFSPPHPRKCSLLKLRSPGTLRTPRLGPSQRPTPPPTHWRNEVRLRRRT